MLPIVCRLNVMECVNLHMPTLNITTYWCMQGIVLNFNIRQRIGLVL